MSSDHPERDRPPSSACREYEWMVGPLVDGELPAAEADQAEQHLRACASCSRLAEDFRSFDRLARRSGEPPAVSPAEWGQMWERISREPTVLRLEVRRGVREWMLPLLSLAALALLAAWLAFALVNDHWEQLDQKAHQIIQGKPEGPGTPGPKKTAPPPARKG